MTIRFCLHCQRGVTTTYVLEWEDHTAEAMALLTRALDEDWDALTLTMRRAALPTQPRGQGKRGLAAGWMQACARRTPSD